MSFLSVLKTIGKDSLQVVHAGAPIANVFMPGAGTALAAITGLVIAAENHPNPAVSSTGPTKQQWVIDTFNALFPIIQAIAESRGEKINLNTAVIPDIINGVVAVMNGLSKLNFSATKETK